LPQGKVQLSPFGIEHVARFDWKKHARKDRSWWLRMERFEYMLPLIESSDPDHQKTAAAWFLRWYGSHSGLRSPNDNAWEGMVAGIRVAVFVRYLKQLEQTADPLNLAEKLREVIREHQEFLASRSNFEANSNHGMWNGLGLLETTRVFANDEYAETALQRIVELTEKSVSKQGLHREHSPFYHFYFLRILEDYTRYLQSLNNWTWSGTDGLVTTRDRMRKASYYMVDHRNGLPTIGDSEGVIDEWAKAIIKRPTRGSSLFDSMAGFAVFKDDEASDRRRYVVFNNQNANQQTSLAFHFHRDAMAVYYSDDGEVILSDGGRYSYTPSAMRKFFVSPAAHNTLFPESHLREDVLAPLFANRAWLERGDDSVTFGAAMYGRKVSREIEIPEKGDFFTVTDRVFGDWPFVALWNIGPDVAAAERITTEGQGSSTFKWILTTKRGRRFALTVTTSGNSVPDGEIVRRFKGSQDPLLGWYATGYESVVKSDVLLFNLAPMAALTMTTRVERLR
jgi:hypothetical protein